ncbi:copper resistance CopC family protein [Nonomuraea maritima]|uniref:copper resistance CopC family protein n=1 Tax=Nonomuraea maritima TaxID=683260 RepID=UPI0037173DCF
MKFPSWRRFGAGLATLACAAVLTWQAAPAYAHDSLKSSSPAKDAEVASVAEIELEYNASVKFPFVVLHDAAGKAIPLDKPRLDGPKVLTDVPQPLAPGAYVIGWRVVSSDGHPIEGEIPFRVKGSASTPSSSGEAAAPADTTPSPAAAGTEPGVPAWVWGGLAVLIVVGAWIVFRTSRRTPGQEETDADH